MGFEPTTLTLARLHSTTELFPRSSLIGMKVFSILVNPANKKKYNLIT